jgi:hypothetical protein
MYYHMTWYNGWHGFKLWFERFKRPTMCHGVIAFGLIPLRRTYGSLMCPGARRLGAGTPITILQFSLLVWLHSVLGFYTIYCVCVRFNEQGYVL